MKYKNPIIQCKHCGKQDKRTGTNQIYCSECQKKEYQIWRKPHKEELNKRAAKWRRENPDKVRGYAKKFYTLNRKAIILQNMKKNKYRYQRLKYDALSYYAGDPPKCACCGETEYHFLSIDHIDGGGSKHRKELIKKYLNIWEHLRRENYPKGFQVLCFNCNLAKGFYGKCPHEDKIK